MKTFLTKSTFRYLEQHLEIKSERHIVVNRFEKYLTRYLSEKLYRLNGLHLAILKGVPKQLTAPVDNFSWILIPKLGRYHKNAECSSLKSDYNNWPIPEDIKEQGSEVVNEYRKWCGNNDLFGAMTDAKRRPVFDLLHQSRWGFFYQGESSHEDNSGFVSKEFLTKEDIKRELKLWRLNFNNWLCENEVKGSGMYPYYLELYSRPSKKSDADLHERCSLNNHDFNDVKGFLHVYREKFQYPLKDLLESLIIIELNGYFDNNIPVIQALGILPCKKCFSV